MVSKSNISLFIYWHHNVTIYFLVYVDDVILTGSNMEALTQLIHTLSVNFHLKYLGSLHYFLGIECHKTPSGLVLSKKKYILDLLKKANMTNCISVSTPMLPSTKLVALDSTSVEDLTLYRSIVNSLQYLLFTRPDLSFSINRVCQYMHSPCISNWQVVKHILRYLKHSLDYGLTITVSLKPLLTAFTDADWAGCLDGKKYTCEYCIFFGNNLVCWSSKKHLIITHSSTKAEYKVLAHGICELLWIQSLLSELGIFLTQPPILYCDHLGATYMCPSIRSCILESNMLLLITILFVIGFEPSLCMCLFCLAMTS